jgi:predicted metal-dependent hydrolase
VQITAALMMLTGSVILAVMISQMGVLLATINAAHSEYTEKLNNVNVMTRKLKLPPILQRRIEQYYYHQFHPNGSHDVLSKLNKKLSKSLVNEMSVFFFVR